jgi:hypothetical protein
MAEPIDFEQFARRVIDDIDAGDLLSAEDPSNGAIRTIAEQFRQVWNARGVADMAKVDRQLSVLLGSTAGPYVKHLDRALRTLDR